MLFFCCVRVAGASFCGHEAGGGERESTASHFSCRRDAPPVTALSRASNSIVGGMTGNVVAASWMDEESLLRVALWLFAGSVCAVFVGSGLWPCLVVRGIELEAMMAVGHFFSSIGGWLLAVCASLLCEGPNPLTRGLAALRWCVCVGSGVELPARARALAVLFPPAICFFRVCLCCFLLFPCYLLLLCSCVEWPHAHGPC
ncbi:retrotransposon hot spot (RHS) protein [Trypanosoma cruzi]|nr:retrotransposon hot spot (RHS) protein [Trypanosoma cruzi]